MYEIAIIPACVSARLTAWIIDAAISIGVMIGIIYWFTGTISLEAYLMQATYAHLAVIILVPVAAHVSFSGLFRSTFGMYAVDIQLLQSDGELFTWSNALRRPFGLALLLGTGFLTAIVPLLNDQRRSVGDYFSGSRVVESLALGKRVSYDPGRIFKSIIKPLGPIGFAVTLGALLLSKTDGANKDIFVDAVFIAAAMTLTIATLIAGLKAKITRVRITPKGVQRSGWFGWSSNLVPWTDIDHARVRVTRLFPYFEVHRKSRRKFRVPLEHNLAKFTAEAMATHGVRLEQ